MKNYYKILEVSESASKEVILSAYKALAKKYHPDLCSESEKPAMEEKMKDVNAAKDILTNSEKRKSYDLKLKADEEQSSKVNEQPKYEENNYTYRPPEPEHNQNFYNYQQRPVYRKYAQNPQNRNGETCKPKESKNIFSKIKKVFKFLYKHGTEIAILIVAVLLMVILFKFLIPDFIKPLIYDIQRNKIKTGLNLIVPAFQNLNL